ncbi:NACHT domain-containing protein [Corallococcus exercitus]|uniref:Uncharacterized protein n=1 Tax=Corallococcus exercitus TaxID=2316736 RepID=A0A7Y4NEQ2_9BACT|nr:hypothetical protein [Corallococcus exercitus]NOK10120.1 hypothetical protein [Corallococcus exercitus]
MRKDLFGFSPDAFEQFVRALSLCVFGSGTKAFGNGPDGGREAIFEGEVPYPSAPMNCWDGYGVIQAKCKEKSESSRKDQQWALALLKKELDTFAKSAKRAVKPQYYVFVVNVELSAAGEGWDKANAMIQGYYGVLPLKGHAIWDANQLRVLLDTHEALRRRFAAYLTTGDVLSALIEELERRRPKVGHVLTAFVEREIRADEAARLDQAGNRTEEQLRLAQLFFDFPAVLEQQLVPPDEKADSKGRLPAGVLRELLLGGARKLDPDAVYQQEIDAGGAPEGRYPTRYVLLGGPGSGKSTVGQFLAQIHRAALLLRQKPQLLEPQTRNAIAEIKSFCEREELPWPATPRYPFRVELSRLAGALASKEPGRVATFCQYLLAGLKREHSLVGDDLIEWFGRFPVLLILDGLDEVPATSNRGEVVRAITDFFAEIRQAGADVFAVATSRHQGYRGEFGGETVAFRHIPPLSPARSLLYVKKYAEARFGKSQPQRALDLIEKLQKSVKREITAQLMSSPLQVTFMATVVAARGDPGEDRWQLFSKYYQTIYDRERQKAVPPYDVVLGKHQATIDRLHHDVGFWLQYQGETSGDRAVSLPIEQFERLVDAYLSEAGYEGTEKTELLGLISQAAQHRLVFITSRIEGELSFDVQSLKEYMAAECIMTGPPGLVEQRLRAIAPAVYWRNVFTFSAGKCFSDAQSRHFKDLVRTLCEDLNAPESLLMEAVRVGSELAIDILQSGAVAESPNHARHMARVALELLAQPSVTRRPEARDENPAHGVSIYRRLSLVYRESLSRLYREELALRIGQSDIDRALGAWPLLVRLAETGVDWAAQLADQSWPSESSSQLMILKEILPESQIGAWLESRLVNLVPRLSIRDGLLVSRLLRGTRHLSPLLEAIVDFGRAGVRGVRGLSVRIRTPGCGDNIAVTVIPMSGHDAGLKCFEALAAMRNASAEWLPYIHAHGFLLNPSAKTLSRTLQRIVDDGWTAALVGQGYERLPWPLSACLRQLQSIGLAELIEKVENGYFGDASEWMAAEERWRKKGVSAEDVLLWPADGFSFDRTIAQHGAPPGETLVSMSIALDSFPREAAVGLIGFAKRIEIKAWRERIVWFALRMASSSKDLGRHLDPLDLRQLMETTPEVAWWGDILACPSEPELILRWVGFFDWLGASEALGYEYEYDEDFGWAGVWQRFYISEPGRLGLLRLLGRIAASGESLLLIPTAMLEPVKISGRRFQLAALLVRLTQPDLSEGEAARLADIAAQFLMDPPEAHTSWLIFETAEQHVERVLSISHFLIQLHVKMVANGSREVWRCERILRSILNARPSELCDVGLLQGLGLKML